MRQGEEHTIMSLDETSNKHKKVFKTLKTVDCYQPSPAKENRNGEWEDRMGALMLHEAWEAGMWSFYRYFF